MLDLCLGVCDHILFLSVASLKMMFSFFMSSMLMTWRAYFVLIIIFLLIVILSWCRVTLVGTIRRDITIFDFKKLAAYIIILDTNAS